jgi:hypothetical protein
MRLSKGRSAAAGPLRERVAEELERRSRSSWSRTRMTSVRTAARRSSCASPPIPASPRRRCARPPRGASSRG